MIFLASAFVSIFLMLGVLVTQLNSFYQAGLVLSAIVFSTAGVFLGQLVTGRPMIDTYNDLRRRGEEPLEAVLRTGAQRLCPVSLTSAPMPSSKAPRRTCRSSAISTSSRGRLTRECN